MEKGLYCQREFRAVDSSLPLNFVTNDFKCLPKNGSGESVPSIRPKDSNPGRLVGEPAPYPSGMAL